MAQGTIGVILETFSTYINAQYVLYPRSPDNQSPLEPLAFHQSQPNHTSQWGHTWEYTALGDSYASGDGSDTALFHTVGQCYQNNNSYAKLLSQQADMGITKFNFQVCTGAATQQVQSCQIPGGAKGDSSCHSSSPDGFGSPKFMTLTVGGNNVEFADLLERCLYAIPGSQDCETRIANTDRDLGTLESEGLIGGAIDDAVAVSGIDRKDVYVTGYVSFFNIENSCPWFDALYAIDDLPGQPLVHLNSTFRDDLNARVRRLNTAISAQSLTAGVNYVDLEARFNTHRWCDSSNSWFNGVGGVLGAGKTQPADKSGSGPGAPNWILGIFHPTADGQKAYANEIRTQLGLRDSP